MKLWYMWATCIIHEKKFLYEWITCVSSKIFKSTVNYNKDSFNSLIIILKYVKWLNKCDLAMYTGICMSLTYKKCVCALMLTFPA